MTEAEAPTLHALWTLSVEVTACLGFYILIDTLYRWRAAMREALHNCAPGALDNAVASLKAEAEKTIPRLLGEQAIAKTFQLDKPRITIEDAVARAEERGLDTTSCRS